MERKTRCQWCRAELTNTIGRPRKFCNPTHREYFYALRRLELLLQTEQGQALLARAVKAVMTGEGSVEGKAG